MKIIYRTKFSNTFIDRQNRVVCISEEVSHKKLFISFTDIQTKKWGILNYRVAMKKNMTVKGCKFYL